MSFAFAIWFYIAGAAVTLGDAYNDPSITRLPSPRRQWSTAAVVLLWPVLGAGVTLRNRAKRRCV